MPSPPLEIHLDIILPRVPVDPSESCSKIPRGGCSQGALASPGIDCNLPNTRSFSKTILGLGSLAALPLQAQFIILKAGNPRVKAVVGPRYKASLQVVREGRCSSSSVLILTVTVSIANKRSVFPLDSSCWWIVRFVVEESEISSAEIEVDHA